MVFLKTGSAVYLNTTSKPIHSATFLLNTSGFIKAVNAIGYRNVDTLQALPAYYILSPLAGSRAGDWWELAYAGYLYPKAQMASQRISDALTISEAKTVS